jgi:hypothetical protein
LQTLVAARIAPPQNGQATVSLVMAPESDAERTSN